MNICKAIIQEGLNKGKVCNRNANNDGYCGRHVRNKTYDEGIAKGKRWCRFFFRGCDNEITDQPVKIVTCSSCLQAKRKKIVNCQHEDCNFKAKEGQQFCGKHERDIYRLEEKEKGIKYCDIDRGCFTICEEGFASCASCLEKNRKVDTARIQQRKILNKELAKTSTKRVCQKCASEFESFPTLHNTDSTKCGKCYTAQKRVEERREDRLRNYHEERKKFLPSYFKQFINDSSKRGYHVELNFEDYSHIVVQDCYYCGYYNEKEAIGIDRINNSLSYTKENCVPCCKICNRIKYIYHPIFFISKAKIISKFMEVTETFYDKWNIYYTRSKNNLYKKYKKEAEKRKLQFLISELQWDTLIRQPCYLCGYKQIEGLGLDRFDNTIREYNLQNYKPCCGSCNVMKHDMQFDTFLHHMKQIATKWEDASEFDCIPMFDNPFKKNTIPYETNNDSNKIPKWNAKSLYYAILSNTDNEFINFYSDYIKENEFQKLKEELLKMTDKYTILECISKYLNMLNVRKKRDK